MTKRRVAFGLGALLTIAALLLVWAFAEGDPGGGPAGPQKAVPLDAGVTSSAASRPPAGALRGGASADAGVPEARSGAGTVVASFGWGTGDGQLGREVPDEANPEAPMSLTVDARGTTWILDQVNGRLVKVDRAGRPQGTVPVPLQAAQDVVVTEDGTALVMDRLVDKAVAVIGPDGKPRGELPLEGKGLAEGGGTTGLFTSGQDVYVEREHGDSVRIGNTSGEKDLARPEVPGRPGQDGQTFLTAGIVEAATGAVAVTAVERSTQQHRFTRQFVLGRPVAALTLLDTDRSGVIYLGVLVEQPGSTPQAPAYAVSLLCLDGLDGRPLGQTLAPASRMADETFREFAVAPEGGVLALERSASGPRLVRYACGS